MTNKIDKLLMIYDRFIKYRTNKIKIINDNAGFVRVTENDYTFKFWLEQQYDIDNKLVLLKFEKYLPEYISV